jgi:hypothetical protein
VNNAISETAGLLAVAVFGLVMSHAFDAGLERRMQAANIAPGIRDEMRGQEARLAAIELPRKADTAQRRALGQAVGESFVGGFRLLMALGAGLALLSAGCAWLTLEGRPRPVRSARRRPSNGAAP